MRTIVVPTSNIIGGETSPNSKFRTRQKSFSAAQQLLLRQIMPAKWSPSTNGRLPKFTPIFLILPQTLVVCQNWLASNLEKDILRKCQKCRRMEDKSDLCSLVCPDHFKFTCLLWHEFFHAHPSKIYNFWWAHAIFGKNNSVLSALEDELWSRDHESFSNV